MQIDFTYEQLGVLDKAVQQLPYFMGAPLIAHINKQIAEQQKIMKTPVNEDELIFPKRHQQNGESIAQQARSGG